MLNSRSAKSSGVPQHQRRGFDLPHPPTTADGRSDVGLLQTGSTECRGPPGAQTCLKASSSEAIGDAYTAGAGRNFTTLMQAATHRPSGATEAKQRPPVGARRQ